MAQHKQGDRNEALRAATKCTQIIETKLPKLSEWHGNDRKDWIFAHTLEGEAKQLLSP